jgi:hypothetical protein
VDSQFCALSQQVLLLFCAYSLSECFMFVMRLSLIAGRDLTAIFGIAVVIVCFASFGSDDEEESVFGYMSSGVIGGTLACLGFTLFYPCVLACVLPAVTTQVEDNHPVQMVRADSNKDNVVPAKLVVEGQIKEVSFGQEAA